MNFSLVRARVIEGHLQAKVLVLQPPNLVKEQLGTKVGRWFRQWQFFLTL